MEAETIEMEPEVTSGEVASYAAQVVRYSVTMADIAKLREQYKEVPEDLTVKANYEVVRKAASLFRGLRSDVEKRRKELKADALAYGKKVDGVAKEITEALTEIEEPFATAKKDFDTKIEIEKREKALAEERRIDGIVERIAGIKALVEANIGSSSAVIEAVLNDLDQDQFIDEWAMEFSEKARITIGETIDKLSQLFIMKLQQEQATKLAAEAETKRLADEEAARIERERLAEEARLKLVEEQAKLEAEKKKLADEQARLASEQKARDEQARLEKEEAERIQKEKDEETARAMAKMLAEIEALKKPVEVVEEKEEEKAGEVIEEVAKKIFDPIRDAIDQTFPFDASPVDLSQYVSPADQRRAAGKAMLEYIGNFTVAKSLLEAIIQGNIPYIVYTGEKV